MNFLHSMAPGLPDLLSAQFQEGVHDTPVEEPHFLRGGSWPFSTDFQGSRQTHRHHNGLEASARYRKRTRDDPHRETWSRPPCNFCVQEHRGDRDFNHTPSGDPFYPSTNGVESYPPDQFRPNFAHPEWEDQYHSPYAFPHRNSYRATYHRRHPRSSSSSDGDSDSICFGCHEGKGRDPDDHYYGTSTCTVEEPNSDDIHASTQRPRRPNSGPQGWTRSKHRSERFNWDFVNIGGPTRPGSPRTLSSSASNPNSLHSPPPSPTLCASHVAEHVTPSGPQEGLPPSIPPQQTPFSESPYHHTFPHGQANTQEPVHRMDRDACLQDVGRMFEELKRNHNNLRGLGERLDNKVEDLANRMSRIEEREAGLGGHTGGHGFSWYRGH